MWSRNCNNNAKISAKAETILDLVEAVAENTRGFDEGKL